MSQRDAKIGPASKVTVVDQADFADDINIAQCEFILGSDLVEIHRDLLPVEPRGILR